MKTMYENQQEYAKELARLITTYPTKRVIVWIDSDGISDDYAYYGGYMYKPQIQTITYTENDGYDGHYIEKDGDDEEDCYAYYGVKSEDWDCEEISRKAKQIPWEEVIAIRVSAC